MSGIASNTSIPKWQLALILGTPIALGLGYLYLKNSDSDKLGTDKDKKKLSDLKNKSIASTISLDGDDKSGTSAAATTPNTKKAPLSLLEQAQDFKNKGNVLFKNGKFDEAIDLYSKAIEICPEENTIDLATFYQNRAAAYELLKKWLSVKGDCTKALELNTRYVKALHRRARAYEHLKELENCLEDITATCILEGFQNKSALFLADRILKELGRIHAKEAMKTRKPILQGKHFVKSYFSSFSQDPIKKLIIAGSGDKGFVRAKTALDNHNYEQVIPACTEEIESSEDQGRFQAEATLLRGTFYLLCGRYKESLSDLNTIINNHNLDAKYRANALIKRASLNMQIEKHEECFEDFEKAIEIDPRNSDVFHHRGQVYVLMERIHEALVDFKKALDYEPEQPLTYVHKCYAEYRLAFELQNTYELMNAMNNFGLAIEKYPDCVECYSLMAQVLSEQQQFDQADTFFEKAIDIEPSNAALFVHRGLLQLQWTGNVDKAVELIQQAIVMDDKCELAYETLGTIEVQRANLERAIELFDKALSLAKSEMELVHLYSLKDAAIAQMNVSKKLGIDMSRLAAFAGSGI